MNIPWTEALAIFIGTLPVLGAIILQLTKLDRIEGKLDAINNELTLIRERLATLEERDRWMHPAPVLAVK